MIGNFGISERKYVSISRKTSSDNIAAEVSKNLISIPRAHNFKASGLRSENKMMSLRFVSCGVEELKQMFNHIK